MRNAAEVARNIAREAGYLAANLQGRVRVREKTGNRGPVTEADLAVEKLVLDRLEASYPDDPVLSEETESDVDLSAPRLWCVDPIDGTREYVEGLGEYAVQIGLLEHGRPVAGAICLPDEGVVIWGWEGGGAFLEQGSEHARIRLEALVRIEDSVAIHSRSHRGPRLEETLRRLGVARTIAAGSVGYKVAQILLGKAHLYLHPGRGTTWWDTAGPVALVRAAGGDVTDARGRPLRYGPGLHHRQGLLFAVPGILETAARTLQSNPSRDRA